MAEKNEKDDEGSEAILPPSSLVLQPFIAKLGHDVEEIRVRAIKNILFKLEHKLICIADLVQERELLIRLLEWFNYTPSPMKKEVLGLLEKLVKHIDTAQVLLKIGGVEFFSHLRQDIEPELFQSVDNVTHLLLSIPQTSGKNHDEWCLYRQDKQDDTEISAHHGHQFKSSSCPVLSNTKKLTGTMATQSVPQLGQPRGYFSEEKEPSVPAVTQSTTAHTGSSSNTTRSQESYNSGGTLSFFQWLPLSSSDNHILSVTDGRLHNSSSTLVAKSCEFLADVLFKDFPAEIFLQRPSVFKSLLELLEFRSSDSGPCVPLCSIHCLKELCRHLHARLMTTSDPALFCPDQECWKSRQNIFLPGNPGDAHNAVGNGQGDYIQERGSGDGGLGSDAASSSSSTEHRDLSTTDDADEDELVMEALQYNQLAVEEMCVMILPHALQVLNGQLSHNLPVLTSTIELLFHVGELIKMVTPDDIWQEGSQSNIVMASSVISSLKLLGEVIVHHMQLSGYQGQSDRTEYNLSSHRMAVVNLTAFLVQLLQSVIPIGQASQVIPSDIVTVLWLLSMDGILSQTHPYLHACLLDYLVILDKSSHQTYLHTKDVCLSFESGCELLKANKAKPSSNTVSHLLHLAENSILGLVYHKQMSLIGKSIKLCSMACLSAVSPNLTQTCHKVVLRLLSHYDKGVRLVGYKECLGMVKDSLRISHVTHPMSSVCQGIVFLLDASVMQQICCFGLYDNDQEVQEIAVDLLETVFLGRLSMTSQLWRRLLDAITPALPFLVGFIGTYPTLDQTILDLVISPTTNSEQFTADGEIMTLQPLQQLRGALQLLFLKDPSIRAQGLAALVGHLASDKSRSWGQRLFRSRQSEILRDLFLVDQLTSTMNSHVTVSHPSVEKAEIIKLWSIYSSKSMDWSIRKSAAEQLAIILQDPEWHGELLELHADEATLEILHEILEHGGDTHTPTTPSPHMELVSPCLKILRLLTEFSWSCRRRLSNNTHIYSTVVMCSVVCHPSVQVGYEAACLMTLLLFHEATPSHMDENYKNGFSLPACLVKWYQLPFNPPIHKLTSKHQSPAPSPQEPNPLTIDPALSMLRFYWNLALHESLDKLCGVQGISEEPSPSKHQYWEGIRWRSLDSQILRCSHVPACLADILQVMRSAASHFPVKLAMTQIQAVLLADMGVAGRGTKMVVQKLYTMHWQEAIERYLLVLPNSIEDDELLIEVLRVLACLLTSPLQPPQPTVTWMARITIQSDGPFLSLLRTTGVHPGNGSSQAATESRRTLRKHILLFFGTLTKRLLQSTLPWRFDGERVLIGELARAVTLNLDLADNPSYYDLPVLESALECLGHVTARSQWSASSKSQDALGQCTSMLQSLVQVVTSFHAGRLGSSTSFMGKGVTYHASLCLVHLVQEMNTVDPKKSWLTHWIHNDDPDSQALTWLVTLWSDRSPEVRWMGLSIATTLAGTIEGHAALIQALQGVAGGVIGRVLPLILDDGECGIVRQQATLMMCNLVGSLNSGEVLHAGIPGQGPGDKEIVSDISTLRTLLDHFRFYTRLQSILTSFTTTIASVKTTSSRACQSSASVSVSTTSSNIPYSHLPSSSQSISVTSEAIHNASLSTSPSLNGMRSPGDQSSVMSSIVSARTQGSQTPVSLVPLLNERGLPSGMSTTSSSTNTRVASAAGSVTSHSTPLTSSLTPAFVGALAQLVQALVAVDSAQTIAALKQASVMSVFWNHLESSELQSFLQAQQISPSLDSSPSLSCAAIVVVREVVHMYTCLVQMTHALARADHTLLFDLQQNLPTMHRIVGLFAVDVSNLDEKLSAHCQVLWLAVSSLLVTLLQSQGPVSVSSATEETLYTHWDQFTAIFKAVISAPVDSPALRSVLLRLLGLLLSCEGKRQKPRKKTDLPSTYLQQPRQRRLTKLLDDDTQNTESDENCNMIRVVREVPIATPPCSVQPNTCGHDNKETKSLAETPNGTQTSDDRNEPSGAVLCVSLLGVYDNMAAKGEHRLREKEHVKIAIIALLGLSQTAKKTALKEGLVETTLEHIKHLHVQLNMDSLQLGKGPSWKKKENPIIDDIVSDLELLGNFIHRNKEVKIACLECGLIDVLHKFWSWCSVETSLRSAVLTLLSTLSAKCPKASICISGGGSCSRASQSGSTFLNSLLKSATSANSKILGNQICHDLEIQLMTFKTLSVLLANLVLTAECRGIIWKSNFLHQFAKLKPLKTTQGRPRHVHRLMGVAWMSILVNLTFFTDGQQMVMKVSGCVNILLELCRVTQGKHVTSDMALLVLRNLCFHSNSKSVLLSNEPLLGHLIANVDHVSCYTRAVAVSALWSLVHNNQKAKVTLKNSGLQKKLEELKLKTDKDREETQSDDQYKNIYLQALTAVQAQMKGSVQ